MGILDAFSGLSQDGQLSPGGQGLLAAGLGILAHNRGLTSGTQAVGMGGLEGLQQYQQSKQMQMSQQLQQLQAMGLGINNAKAMAIYQMATQGMNGQPAQGGPASAAPAAPTSSDVGGATAGSSGAGAPPQSFPVLSPQSSPMPPAGGAPMAPNAPQPAPGAQGFQSAPVASPANPFSPGGQMNPMGIPENVARMTFMQNPEEYAKNAVLPAYKPADIVSQLRAAGIDPNSTLGRQIAQQSIAKANYIAPVSMRPGGGALMQNGQVVTMPGMPAQGFQNMPNGDGTYTSVPVQGGTASSYAASQAAAGGKGSVTPAQYYDPRVGAMVNSNQTYVATGGQMGANPGQGSQSGPLLAAPPIGGADVATQAAQRYSGLVQAAGSVPNAINGYDRALGALANTTSGKGANQIFDVTGVMNTLGIPLGKDEATNYQTLQKYLANAASQAAAASGYTGSDARFEAFTHGQPNAQTMNPTALSEAIKYVKAQQLGVLAKNNAANSFLQQNGNNYSVLPQFETHWSNTYSPDVMYLRSLPPAEQQTWFKAQPQQQQQQIMRSYQGMAGLGAF